MKMPPKKESSGDKNKSNANLEIRFQCNHGLIWLCFGWRFWLACALCGNVYLTSSETHVLC